jgi:homogentisate 1,2-dioxygenase
MTKRQKQAEVAAADDWLDLAYCSGFNSHVETEAKPGVLPVGQNSPQLVKHGLFTEQLSGTAFTCPRATNRRTWVYRLSPSVRQGGYEAATGASRLSADFSVVDPQPRRWSPLPLASVGDTVDFVDGLQTICGAGDPQLKDGVAIHMYACNAHMRDRAFCNADGELLVVPQLGALHVTTELGRLHVGVGEIFVVPRNFRFSVSPAAPDEYAACRGYVLEVFAGRGFVLPELGPLGANGLAEPRDFLAPTAWFEDRACPGGFTVTTKFAGKLFDTKCDHSPYGAPHTPLGTNPWHPLTSSTQRLAGPRSSPSSGPNANASPSANLPRRPPARPPARPPTRPSPPLPDVVAWHGNYTPYKYDLARFHAVNTVTADHPDPSIFTVLTCPSHEAGVAVADFVIFPPRWLCAEHTLYRPPHIRPRPPHTLCRPPPARHPARASPPDPARTRAPLATPLAPPACRSRPPYFHRNVMSEFMGLVSKK